MTHFLSLWTTRTPKGSRELLEASGDLIASLVSGAHAGLLSRTWPLPESFLGSCLSGYLLALFTTSQGREVHSWVLYELGMGIIATCNYDDGVFFSLFGITPTQMAYVFFLLSYTTSFAHHIGNPWNPPAAGALLGAQAPERGQAGHDQAAWVAAQYPAVPQDAPLVIDVGMGLGADTRYYLAQGFRVVAIEANAFAVRRATSDDWLQPFLRSGQLVVLQAAIVAPARAGQPVPFFAYLGRPEQSRTDQRDLESTEISVRTVACADLLRQFGRAVYMKVDVEEQTVGCIEALHQEWALHVSSGRAWAPPEFLSFEVENTGLLPGVTGQLTDLGYSLYKVCRQSVFSPSACEIRDNETKVLGCGSGPFGGAAVDYLHGPRWRDLSRLEGDAMWHQEFGENRDWFDIHVTLGA